MPQRHHAPATLAVLALMAAVPAPAGAQGDVRDGRFQTPVRQVASAAFGAIHGVVRDDLGTAISGANVVAMGTALAAVRSDDRGRFRLDLPPGEYILRATREGYVSRFREPIRIQTSVRLERNITLVPVERSTIQAGAGVRQPGPGELLPADDGTHAHSEVAWRLRHLFRSILRDEAPAGGGVQGGSRSTDFQPQGTFLDRALQQSAHVAMTFFTRTDFSGQVNFLASGAIADAAGWRPERWSQGVAYAAVSAPVGGYGDWQVRGAVNASDPSSWVLLGEYQARDEQAHAFHVGVSYSVQGDRGAAVSPRGTEGRSVGAVFGYDQWRVSRGLALEYGLRVDRYDYVTDPAVVSPRIGAAVEVMPGTRVRARAAQHVIAPGASDFLPPTSSGPWLPPERTFSALDGRVTHDASQVRHLELALEQAIGADDRAVLTLRRFHQTTRDQIASVFRRDVSGGAGHYRVATAGDVTVDGWGVSLAGDVTPRMQAAVTYLVGAASWSADRATGQLAVVAPSAVRDVERLHDVRFSLDTDVTETDTRVSVGYRVSSAFSRNRASEPAPGLGARFDIEVHQGLPYQPLRGSQLEVLLAIRNLFRGLRDEGSLYDELLTIAPPLRLMGGVRVRF